MSRIRIAILGYGNLGRGVELAVAQNEDMELVGIFTRRDPSEIKKAIKESSVYNVKDIMNFKEKVDVLILCGGSASDLLGKSLEYAKHFNTVDSFDNHGKIPEYFKEMDDTAKEHGNLSLISTGWDPGLFSLNRLISQAVLPSGNSYTFWGKGLSQGHSEAVRRVEGVKYGVQYTIPIESKVQSVRNSENPPYSAAAMHKRECYVVAKEGFDKESIRNTIVNMPNYFADYDTTVNFISEEEFLRDHQGMGHGGFVIRSGVTGVDKENSQVYEFSLKLESNPEFTASVIVAYARAVHRMATNGANGAVTVFDIPPALISPVSNEELRKLIL